MTENEAIKILISEKHCLDKPTKGLCKINCGDCKENIPITYQEKAREVAITALEEIQQYREIGTVEECREAREKEIPKIPKFMSMIGEYNAMFRCFCGYGFSYDCTDTEPFFCKKCGQALRMESEE